MNVFASLSTPPVDKPGRGFKRTYAPRAKPNNPWGLTPSECKTIAAVAKLGRIVDVADALGLRHKTIENQLLVIKKKMGVNDRTPAAIAWDRFTRGAALPANET